MSCDALNLLMPGSNFGYFADIVLLLEVHSSLAIAQEICFPKQHYESIVPQNQALIKK